MDLIAIKRLVERASGLDDISKKTRKKEYVIARCAYYILAQSNTKCTNSAIGELVCVDHAGVYHAINNTVPSFLNDANDNRLDSLIDKCIDVINGAPLCVADKRAKDREKMDKLMMAEISMLKKQVDKIEDPFIKKIMALDNDRFEEFKRRAEVMLYFVSSYRYDTEHRSEPQMRQK